MSSGFTLEIPYNQLLLLVMALFMFVGATRGWYREFITSCLLLVLTGFLVKPQLAAPIVDYISRFVRLLMAFVGGRGDLDPGPLLERYRTISVPFDGKDPYVLLVVVLVGGVLLSYGTRNNGKSVNALSHMLGGLLGLCNGFLSVSLIKEYVLSHFQKRAPELMAAGSPPPYQFALVVRGLPSGQLLRSEGQQIMLVLLLVLMAASVLVNKFAKKPVVKL